MSLLPAQSAVLMGATVRRSAMHEDLGTVLYPQVTPLPALALSLVGTTVVTQLLMGTCVIGWCETEVTDFEIA